MGKKIRKQRRGKGSTTFRAPSHRYRADISYKDLPSGKAKIIDLIHDPGRTAPLAKLMIEDRISYYLPPEGIKVGDIIEIGGGPKIGNVLPLAGIPEGTQIFNIENRPGDGGKLVRSSGASARVVAHEKDKVAVLLPSRRIKKFDSRCKATIGRVAGGGRVVGFGKAGAKYYAMKARGRYWPVTKGVSMNPVDHPFGGSTKPGKPKTVSKHRPPGRRVGSIASKRTGRRKRK